MIGARVQVGSRMPRDGAARRRSRARALALWFATAACACGSSGGASDADGNPGGSSTSDHGSGGAPSADHGAGGGSAQSHGTGGTGTTAMQHDAGAKPQTMMREDAATPSDVDAAAPAAEPTAFRVGELYVRDPHMYLGDTDITDQELLGTSVNGSLIKNGLTMDYDMDGFLDVSILPILEPLDPAAKDASLHLVDARCSSAEKCEASTNSGLDVRFAIENRAQGSCLEPMADTTSGFSPAVDVPMAPCFVTTDARDFSIDLGGVSIALTAARIAASYEGDAPGKLTHGLLMGFVTDAHAMQALLPDYLPLLGGTPLTDYLRDQDRDMAHSPNSENGFWLYINFVATPVDYAEM
jgi:hypothetical protein